MSRSCGKPKFERRKPMNDVCKIPTRATYRIVDGKAVMVAAEYADIPASAIAAYLVDKLGVDAIFGEGARD